MSTARPGPDQVLPAMIRHYVAFCHARQHLGVDVTVSAEGLRKCMVTARRDGLERTSRSPAFPRLLGPDRLLHRQRRSRPVWSALLAQREGTAGSSPIAGRAASAQERRRSWRSGSSSGPRDSRHRGQHQARAGRGGQAARSHRSWQRAYCPSCLISRRNDDRRHGDPDALLTLGDVARECPRWHCYAGAVVDRVYARLRGSSPPLTVSAATSPELITKIREAEAGLP